MRPRGGATRCARVNGTGITYGRASPTTRATLNSSGTPIRRHSACSTRLQAQMCPSCRTTWSRSTTTASRGQPRRTSSTRPCPRDSTFRGRLAATSGGSTVSHTGWRRSACKPSFPRCARWWTGPARTRGAAVTGASLSAGRASTRAPGSRPTRAIHACGLGLPSRPTRRRSRVCTRCSAAGLARAWRAGAPTAGSTRLTAATPWAAGRTTPSSSWGPTGAASVALLSTTTPMASLPAATTRKSCGPSQRTTTTCGASSAASLSTTRAAMTTAPATPPSARTGACARLTSPRTPTRPTLPATLSTPTSWGATAGTARTARSP
mmetsp:Transcript_7181/g.20929  ORF Transcript_7181/g.20929 Transcript_7181/m.20929 type:complete len:322 (-) Transcript_7181:963-1928(-)